MDKTYKQHAIDTVCAAIDTSSTNLVDEVANKLAALHISSGINEPLKFSKADANRIAFDARVAFNKIKKIPHPRGIEYENSEFSSFRARHLELTKIIQNVQHYPDALKVCNALVKKGTFRQAGASEITRAMAAIGGGASTEQFKLDTIAGKADRDEKKKKSDEKAITVEGFNAKLEALIEDAAEHRVILSEDRKQFTRMPPEKPVADVIAADPDADGETVLDGDALADLMNMTAYQNATPANQGIMMAAFMRR